MTRRTAVVTGAASGMGRLMAARLAEAGWNVVAVDLEGAALEAAAAEIGATAIGCDVGHDDQVTRAAEAVLQKFGTVDRLVNAAGIAVSGTVEEVSQHAFWHSMNVNYLGTVRWVKALAPHMRARRSGELVLFASLAGWMPAPGMAAYTATKFAVVGFAETLAMELRGKGVTVRCVCPGAVQTPMLDDVIASGMPERLKKLSRAASPALVIDAIEASLGRRGGTFVFPGLPAKSLWRARRFLPSVLASIVRRLSAAETSHR